MLRRTQTTYNLDAPYVNRGIIGLPAARDVYDGAGALASKVGYGYDSGGGSAQWIEDVGQATQHDHANYGKTFDVGRGNLCWVQRYDVTDPHNAANTVLTSGTGYNITGSLTWQTDPLGHYTSRISYADSFSTAGNPATFAYPTTLTDADGYASSVQYNYVLGAVTRTEGPPPAGQSQGVVQTLQYDEVGRIERVTTVNNGAYTRWVYPAYQNSVLTYATVQEGVGEAFSGVWFDGAGRLLYNFTTLPNSAGGYSLDWRLYDTSGRVKQQARPTEINANWIPSGDDAAGWVFSYQQYDWKGRPTLTTMPGGATTEMSYGGCGCAGGEVTTTRDERGRRKRYTKDALGRLAKVEELNLDQSVYATTQYAYNARDQITSIDGAGQVRTLEYDGYGRLFRRTTPEQRATTYSYYPDDTTQTVTDARGASTSFVYHKRHLVKRINYGVPAGVGATAGVAFEYDAAGNRTGMTDGAGSVSYSYNALSRLESETRTFDGVTGPHAGGGFQLSYRYNLAGELTRVTNPWGSEVAYGHDAQGRVTGVTGAGAGSVPVYAEGIQYRAFGGLKGLTYGNNRTLALAYDERSRLKTWNVSGVLGWDYSYDKFYEDSHRVTYAKNISSSDRNGSMPDGDPTLDRSYEYDHLGRLRYSHSEVEARMHAFNQPADGGGYGPYSQHTAYDVWGNVTGRVGWGDRAELAARAAAVQVHDV